MGAVPILMICSLLAVVIVKLLSNMSWKELPPSKCKSNEIPLIHLHCQAKNQCFKAEFLESLSNSAFLSCNRAYSAAILFCSSIILVLSTDFIKVFTVSVSLEKELFFTLDWHDDKIIPHPIEVINKYNECFIKICIWGCSLPLLYIIVIL